MAKTATAEKIEVTESAPVKEAPISALLANEIWAREAGVKFNTWEAVPPVKTPFDNMLRRSFWSNVAMKMKPGDKIVIYPRDGAYYAELLVWDAGQNWADVSLLVRLDRPTLAGAPGVENEFEIGRDPVDGVVVKKRSTGERVKSNFANHEDARRWILDHQRVLRS